MSSPHDGTRRKFLTLTAAALGTGSLSGNALAAPGESGPADRRTGSADAADASLTPAAPANWTSYQHDAGNTGATAAPGPGDDAWVDWSEQVSDRRLFAPAVADGTAYVADVGETLTAFDLDDRETRWTVDLDGVEYAPAVADGRESRAWALDAEDGAVRWEYAAGQSLSSPAIADDTVYFAGDERAVAVDLTGEERWSVPTRDLGNAWLAPAVADGTVYLGDGEGFLYALAESDDLRWRSDSIGALATGNGRVYVGGDDLTALAGGSGGAHWTARTGDLAAPPVAAAGNVYVATGVELIAFAADGRAQWQTQLQSQAVAGPVVADGTLYVATGEERVVVRAFDADAGTHRWTYAGDCETISSVADIAVGNGQVYAVCDGQVVALDADAGEERWTVGVGVRAIAVGSSVYAGTDANEVVAHAPDGSERWRASLDRGEAVERLAASAVPGRRTAGNGTRGASNAAKRPDDVYAVTTDGVDDGGSREWLVALDRDGVRWTFHPAFTPFSALTAPVVGNGTVVVGASDHRVYALDTRDGSERRRFETGGPVEHVTVGNRIYAASDATYAFRWLTGE